MVDKIEMSLDDIIKSNKKPSARRGGGRGGGAMSRGGQQNRRRGAPGGGLGIRTGGGAGGGGGVQKGRGRGGIVRSSKYTRGDVNSAWKHDMFDGGKKLLSRGIETRSGGGSGGGSGIMGPAKLIVSNLDYGVSESDINELFADFGPLKNASVHYDRSGRSLGTADVVFERKSDAIKAMKQYNGVPLDGRPMNIQLATSDVPQSAPIIKRAPTNMRNNVRRGGPMGGRTPRGGGGGGGSGRGLGGGNSKTPAPTAEELDAELDAYVKDMK